LTNYYLSLPDKSVHLCSEWYGGRARVCLLLRRPGRSIAREISPVLIIIYNERIWARNTCRHLYGRRTTVSRLAFRQSSAPAANGKNVSDGYSPILPSGPPRMRQIQNGHSLPLSPPKLAARTTVDAGGGGDALIRGRRQK